MSKCLTNINSLVAAVSSRIECGMNSVYKATDIACRIVQSAAKNLSLEAMYKLTEFLSADRMLDRLHCFSEEGIRSIIPQLHKDVKLPKIVTLAIDFTEKEYYGDKSHLDVIGSKGGKYVVRYIEVSTVDPPLFIDAIPVNTFNNDKATLVKEILDGFRSYFPKTDIGLLLLDKGFYVIDVVEYLVQNRIQFIMPAIKNKCVQKLVKQFEKGEIGHRIRYRFGKTEVNLLFLRAEEETYVYMTNTNKGPVEVALLYKRRWQIETNFREQNNFLLKTKTTNFTIRYLAFVISGLLFNLWQLARRIVPYTLESYIFKQYMLEDLLAIWQQESGVVIKSLRFYLPA